MLSRSGPASPTLRIRLRLTAALVALASFASAWGAAPADGADVLPPGAQVFIQSNNQVTDLLEALSDPGTIVRVHNHVEMDLGLHEGILIADGVQLLGGRSSTQAGPRLFTRRRPGTFFKVRGDNVRISGLRIQGPDYGVRAITPIKRGIQAKGVVDLEIDNNEISGFSGVAVELVDLLGRRGRPDPEPPGRIPTFGPPRVRVHDNFIHHNRNVGRDGYGVAVKNGMFAWIERNVFDFNRHAIEGDGDRETGYVAYDNLVLSHGGEHRHFPIYGWRYTHQFDMHGTLSCLGHLNCGDGGHHIDIRHNAFWYSRGPAVKIRGTPRGRRRCGAAVYENTFRHRFISSAVQQTLTSFGLCRSANQTNFRPRVRACLINGDNALDNFVATGRHWWYQHSRRMHWTFIRRTREVPAGCPPPPPAPPPNQPNPDQLPPPPPQPPPPATSPSAPDLVISDFTQEQYTVTNQGNAPAGPFRVSVVSANSTTHNEFSGLAPGQSATMSYSRGCELREVRADTLNQVSESNENNNNAGPVGPQFC